MQFRQLALSLFLGFCTLLSGPLLKGQSLFENADTFQTKRFWPLVGTAVVGYGAAVYGLSNAWYANEARSSFHFFDDRKEWLGIDKGGHIFTTYFETKWAHELYRWTGLNDNSSLALAAGTSILFQTTIEIFDGHSEKWGFSLADFTCNLAGAGIYVGQHALWQEQRFTLKFSAHIIDYPQYMVPAIDGGPSYNLANRARELYGTSIAELVLKDYNGLTIWLSGNLNSFFGENQPWIPDWLNLSIGYSAENLYGGFENTWPYDGPNYALDKNQFPRTRQYILSPDIDLSRIKTKSKVLKALLKGLNVFKIPMPALEITGKGKIKGHALYF